MGDDKHNRLTISCPRCEKGYRVKTEWIGRRITCKDCQNSFPIQIDEKYIDIESKLHELIIENERIRKEVQGLREKSKVSFKEESLQISVEGLDSMLLRLHQNSIEYVNSTFCKTYKINKEDILGKEKSILKQVIPAPIYKTLDTPQEAGVFESKAIDGKGKIYEVRKTYTDQYLDIVFSDVTSQQKFKEYVSKYVSHDLVELDESELQTFRIPERRFMTVSFTDLRGFTAMSETLTPEEVRTTMNAYLEEIIHAINMNKATVDKIVGDEVMALYGAPKYYKDHAFRAIKTGCDQIRNLNALQKVFSKIGKIIPDCGVGINSGDMVLGNMGSSTHQDYTVLGAAVNLAARLCGAAKGAQVVLTESTLHHVIENLPEGWSFKKSKVQTDKHNSEIRGKVESSYELPRELQGLRYVIGPKSKTGIELKYQFDYEYSIKIKGVKNPLPIISVCDFGPTPDEDVLSSNTIDHKGEKVFGKYRLIELIGKGGMGEVWKARDPFGNIFALKMLLAGEAATEHQIKRFKREAKIMAKLNHRGLCKIIEIGEVDKITYIAMEYIEGATFTEVLQKEIISDFQNSHSIQGMVKKSIDQRSFHHNRSSLNYSPLPVEIAISLIISCCQAIEYAHNHEILHRDIKPSNIIINKDGDPVIMDFGLAKIDDHNGEEASMEISVSGEIIGTIEYMSPEQAEAKSDMDATTDVYSLASVLFLTLTGKKYFESTGNLLNDIGLLKDYQGLRLKDVNPDMDLDLDIILYKALRPSKQDRYQQVKDFRLDLQRYALGEVISAKDVTIYEVINKAIKRHKSIFVLSSSFIFILVMLIVYYVLNIEKERNTALLALQQMNIEKTRRLKTESENAPVWYEASIDQAKMSRMKMAKLYLSKAIDLAPLNIDYKILEGEFLIKEEQYKKAKDHFHKLTQTFPKDKRTGQLYNLMEDFISKKRYAEANYELQHYFIENNRPYLFKNIGHGLLSKAFENIMQKSYQDTKISISHEKIKGVFRHNIEFMDYGIGDLSPLKGWNIGHLVAHRLDVKNFDILNDINFTSISIARTSPENLEFVLNKNLDHIALWRMKGQIDLTIFEDSPIQSIHLTKVSVKDFSVFKKLKLNELVIRACPNLKSIEFIRSMTSLKSLSLIRNPKLEDLSPLLDLNLRNLCIDPQFVKSQEKELKEMSSLKKISTTGPPLIDVKTFWQNFDK